ncbi:MAG: hypothetical protein K0R70_2189 [Steroidobacteraceae bacterium]|nr:hypothetical protein [Steroidobacteraceae bacterium]
MKRAFVLVALALALIVLTVVVLAGSGDLCLAGKGLLPCDWTPIDIKVHNDPRDR